MKKKTTTPVNVHSSGKKRKGKRKGCGNPKNACVQTQMTMFGGAVFDEDIYGFYD